MSTETIDATNHLSMRASFRAAQVIEVAGGGDYFVRKGAFVTASAR